MNFKISDFREISLDDREAVQDILDRFDSRSCEQNYCNMFNWNPVCGYKIQLWQGRLLVYLDAEKSLLYPAGEDLPPAQLAGIVDIMLAHGMGDTVFDVPPEYLRNQPDYASYFTAESFEETWDYLYSTAKLDELPGPRLRKKRNHISQFERQYPRWHTIPLRADTVGAYETFIERFYQGMSIDRMLRDDYTALETALKFFSYTGMEGLALHTGQEIAAIALFSRQNKDTYTIHFEKADKNIVGASQAINRLTAAGLRYRARYLNREQDMGISGLRKSKRSYDPEFQLKNLILTRR